MHKVRISGVRTLEAAKFNGDTGEMENPSKGTIKWGQTVPLTEAALYNNTESWLLTDAEFQALTGGKNYSVPVSFIHGLKNIMSIGVDMLNEAENQGQVSERQEA